MSRGRGADELELELDEFELELDELELDFGPGLGAVHLCVLVLMLKKAQKFNKCNDDKLNYEYRWWK